MRRLAIIGTGGHGREALDIVHALNAVAPTYEVIGFLDDNREPGSVAHPHQVPVLGPVELAVSLDAAIVVAVGQPAARRRIVENLGDFESVSLVHPHASIGSHVAYGDGLIMAAGARVTHAVRIGDHVHLNVDSSISHDCDLGSFITITPGARLSGAVSVGSGVWMGINSSAIQGVTISEDVTVGAGAAVISDLPPGCTAVGVPAEPLPETRT